MNRKFTENRKVLCFALTLVLVMTSFSFVFAAPDAVGTCNIGVTRASDTVGYTDVNGSLTQIADISTCTAILQEKSGSSWITATGVPYTKSSSVSKGYSTYSLSSNWTLVKGKVYRIMVTVEDKKGTTYTSSSYGSDSF